MKKTVPILILSCLISACNENKNALRDGNADYKKEDYADAEINYLKALQTDSSYTKANYNLANTFYRQATKLSFEKAHKYYSKVEPLAEEKPKALYNDGNTHFVQAIADSTSDKQKYIQHLQQAVELYKAALKIESQSQDAKYNLTYAQWLLDKEKNQQQNQQNQQQQNKNQQNKNSQDQPQNQPPRQDRSKENPDPILNAMKNKEQQTLENTKKEKTKTNKERIEKDW